MGHSRSFFMSDLSDSLTVTHLSWVTWAILSQSLICLERSEQIAHCHSFDLSRMSKWAMSKWAKSQPWFSLLNSFCYLKKLLLKIRNKYWNLFADKKSMKAQQIFKNKNISTSATSGLTSTTSVWELSWTSRVLIHSLGRPEAVVGGQGTRLAVTPNQASPPGPSSWVRMRGVDGSRRRLWPS